MRNIFSKVAAVILSITTMATLIPQAACAADSVPETAKTVISAEAEASDETVTDVTDGAVTEETAGKTENEEDESSKDTAITEVTETESDAGTESEAEEADGAVADEDIDLSVCEGVNLVSKRLIVIAEGADLSKFGDALIYEYNGVSLLQFDTIDEAKIAYAKLYGAADHVEADGAVAVAYSEGSAATTVSTGTEMSEDDNPLYELEQAEKLSGYDIALIDTGADGADASVSMIGDDTSDENGHGTSMLSYIKEIYPEATVLSIKALGSDGKGDASAVYTAIEYAIGADVKIINLSISAYSTSDNALVAEAIAEAVSKGIVVVGSAGNNGINVKNFIPGSVDEAIIVGSAQDNGEKLSSSNYGSTVDYNVVAGSTSEAAAKMSAFIAKNGTDAIGDALNDGLIYETGCVAPESDDAETDEDDEIIFAGDMDGDFTVDDAGGAGGSSGTGSAGDPDAVEIQWVIYDDDYDALGYAYIGNNVSNGNNYDAVMEVLEETGAWGGWNATGSDGVTAREQIVKALDEAIANCREAYHQLYNTYEGYSPRIAAVGWAQYQGTYNGTVRDDYNEDWLAAWNQAAATVDNSGSLQHNGVTYQTTSSFHFNASTDKSLEEMALEDLYGNSNIRIIVLDDTMPESPNGEAYITKKSGDTTITDGNDCYSLAGAEFTIYTDSNCKTVATDVNGKNAVLTVTSETSGTGTTDTITLKAGTYYVKETKAPTGYVLDTSTGTLTVRSGEKATVTFTDEPAVAPLNLTVSKNVYYNDEITDTPVEGAVFKVEYFDNYTCSGTAARTWYYASNENGEIDFGKSSYLAGDSYKSDDLYTDANGSIALPLGSIKVTEESAPYGYEISDVVLTAAITLGSDGEANAAWTNGSGSKVELNGDKVILGEDVSTTSVIVSKTTTSSALSSLVSGNGLYSQEFSGAEFTVRYTYAGTTTNCGTYTTGSDGTFTIENVPVGAEVTVTEVKAPEGYAFPETVTQTITAADGTGTVTFKDEPVFGTFDTIVKVIESAGSLKSDGIMLLSDYIGFNNGSNGCNGIENAVFEVRYYENCTGTGEASRTWYFATDKYGCVTFGSADYLAEGYDSDDLYISNGVSYMPLGWYEVTEVEAPYGIITADSSYHYLVQQPANGAEAETTDNMSDSGLDYEETQSAYYVGNEQILAGVKIYKVSAETDEREVQGVEATFEGAEITIYNASDREAWSSISDTKVVEGKNYYKDDAILTLTLDENGYAESDVILPYGDYCFIETRTTDEGYLISEDVHYFTIGDDTVDEDGYVDLEDDPAEDYIIRADLEFGKLDIDGSKMAYIPFLVSLVDEDGNIIESHVAVTDANGEFSSKTREKSTDSVNTLDAYYDAKTGKYTGTNEQLIAAASDNIWFDEITAVEDGRGSLIYGHYVITELGCEANAGNDMLTTELFVEEELVDVFFEGEVYEPENTFVDLIIHPESDLIDDETGLKTVSYGTEVSVTDTFRYDHLKVTNTYKLTAEIVYVDRDGSTSSLGSSTIEFTPEKAGSANTSNGTVDNTIIIDTTGLDNGGYVCAVDYLYVVRDGEDVFLTSHNEDYADEDQMLNVPYVTTTAIDAQTLAHTGAVIEDAKIVDTVEYEGLADKGVYMVTGTLRYADSGEVVPGADGQPCVIEQVIYVLEKATGVTEGAFGMMTVPTSGSFDMPAFVVDAEDFAGETLVITEEITDYHTGKTAAQHYDLTDENQTIHYLTVDTAAKDSATETQTGSMSGTAAVVDTMTVTNAVVGETYTITGELVYQEDFTDANGTEHKAGEAITTHDPVEVTAEATTFTAELTYTYDSTLLNGATAVVFEDVYRNGALVAAHHDIDSDTQNVRHPAIATTAADGDTEDNAGTVSEDNTIVDTVSLTNLNVGDTYKVVGTLMMQDGTETGITVESDVFAATERDMTVELIFGIDTSELGGQTVVVFEELYFVRTTENGEGELIETAEHKDLEDEAQSVYYPEVTTEAKDAATDTHTSQTSEETTTVDIVTVENTVIGKDYTVCGILLYQKDFVDAEGNEHFAGETIAESEPVTVTAADNTTIVEITFTYDASLLCGTSGVVFEDVYHNDTLVALHHDIEDESQTVYFPAVGTIAADDRTDDSHIGTNDEYTTITDTVELTNLVTGDTYKVTGQLMYQDGTEVIINDEIVTAESETFVATEKDMTIEITFSLDTSDLAGETLTAYEKLMIVKISEDGEEALVEAASHEDPEDGAQSIYIPALETEFTDSTDRSHAAAATEGRSLTDTVALTNLVPGYTYKLSAHIYDKTTGELLEEVEEEVAFTADAADMTVDVVFEDIDLTGLEGHALAAFEYLYYVNADGEDVPTGEHEDPEDTAQTVYVPQIETFLTDNSGLRTFAGSKDAILIDTVSYDQLMAGETYTLFGKMIDKSTGEIVGEGYTVFTADAVTGEAEVSFDIDTYLYTGHELVAFEYLYAGEYDEIPEGAEPKATHEDIDDEDQTVSVENPAPQTGLAMSNMSLFGGTALIVLAGIAFALAFIFRKKRVHQD